MTNIYEFDSLPDDSIFLDVQPLPDDLRCLAYESLVHFYEHNWDVAMEARVAYVYDRNGYMSFDPVYQRNTRYGSSNDDLIIQITLRASGHKLSNPSAKNTAPVALIDRIKEWKADSDRIELEEANARDAAEAQRLLDIIEERKLRLKALKD